MKGYTVMRTLTTFFLLVAVLVFGAGAASAATFYGTTGSDVIVGTPDRDAIYTGQGDDTVDPRGGPDSVTTGAGNDRINSADGERDTVLCGTGYDVVTADQLDYLSGCEDVTFVVAT